MKSIFALLILMAFMLPCFTAEDGDAQLPKATEPIISELNSAMAKAATEAIKKLQKIQGDLTKKNDLDGAMATKKYIEGLQKSIDRATPVQILFVKAEWGADQTWVDVTPDITAIVSNGSLTILTLVGSLDESLRRKYTDPFPNSHKQLRFTFANSKVKVFTDNVQINLPLK